MKKFILIISALFAAFAINAQVNNLPIIGNKFTFGIDGGLALPASQFGSSGALDPSAGSIAGNAKTGFCYDVYAGFKFSKIIGIMALFGMNTNSYNASGLTNQFGSATVSGAYNVSEYLVGPYLSITLIKIKIEAKLLAGMVSGNYPTSTFNYNGLMNTYGESVVTAFQNGSAFGYCVGAKIKYMMIGGMLGIGFGLNYVGSDLNYKGTNSEVGAPALSTSFDNKMNVGVFQPTLGLSLDI